MRILFVAGGTAGPLTPLLAVAEELRRTGRSTDCQFVIDHGVSERRLVETAEFPFTVASSGKLRRYWSFHNAVDILLVALTFFKALWHLRILQPDLVVTAGSYNGVPYCWAARILSIPTAVHQQDVTSGLANRLIMRGALYISVTFLPTLTALARRFPNVAKTGNPVRSFVVRGNAERAKQTFQLQENLPVLLVLGGSSGAHGLNALVAGCLEQLLEHCQIIHVLGNNATNVPSHARYHSVPFLTENIADAYAVANVVVSRAGVGTLSELAVLGKPTIIVPMPETHQEANAAYVEAQHAAVVFDQRSTRPQEFASAILALLDDREQRRTLAERMKTMNDPEAAVILARQYQHLATQA